MSVPEPNPDPQLQMPPRLVRELKGTFGRPPAIPPELAALLQREVQARLRLASPPSPGRVQPFPRWLAAAAAIVAAAVVTWFPVGSGKRGLSQQADLNGDGQVDILDSYQLARRLQQGRKVEPALDLNGDGVVDAKDVEVLTTRIVQLGKEKG